MSLGLFNGLIMPAKENKFVQNFINELSDYLKNVDRKACNNMYNKIEKNNESVLKEENTLYQVVDRSKDGIYLKNTKDNKVFEETNMPEKLKNMLQNDFIVRYKNGEYTFEQELTDDFLNSLVSIKEYKEIQNEFVKESNILQLDSNTIYNVVKHEKNYSILGYKGNNTIKVPNVLLPYFIDNETVLKYEAGKFKKAI